MMKMHNKIRSNLNNLTFKQFDLLIRKQMFFYYISFGFEWKEVCKRKQQLKVFFFFFVLNYQTYPKADSLQHHSRYNYLCIKSLHAACN